MGVAQLEPRIRPAVRARRVPPLDPPFDDEAAAAWWGPSVDQLALDLRSAGPGRQPTPPARQIGPPPDRPLAPCDAAAPMSAGPPRTAGGYPVGPPAAPRPADGAPTGGSRSAGGLPPGALATAGVEARQAARRLLGCCLEILDGHRPIAHVRRLADAAEAPALVGQLTAAVRRLARPPAAARQPGGGLRVRLVRVCEPRPGVAEVAAVLGRGDRSWALALRIERRPGGWLGTVIHLL